jgi:hypothetical protein
VLRQQSGCARGVLIDPNDMMHACLLLLRLIYIMLLPVT